MADEAAPAGDVKQDPEATADAAPSAEAPPPPGEEGFDPQLLVLCLVLWLVAGGILFAKWDSMRIDWYLGNLKEAADTNRIDEESLQALVDLSADGDVLGYLRAELDNRQITNQRYRVAVLLVVERIPGAEAFELLVRAASDLNFNVRANAYRALGRRAEGAPAEEATRARELIALALTREADLNARGEAARIAGQLKVEAALWPLILNLREMDGERSLALREACLDALLDVSGVAQGEMPVDNAAPREARWEQIAAWEDWYVARGGVIPPGQSRAEAEQARAEAEAAGVGARPPEEGSSESPAEGAGTPSPQDDTSEGPGDTMEGPQPEDGAPAGDGS